MCHPALLAVLSIRARDTNRAYSALLVRCPIVIRVAQSRNRFRNRTIGIPSKCHLIGCLINGYITGVQEYETNFWSRSGGHFVLSAHVAIHAQGKAEGRAGRTRMWPTTSTVHNLSAIPPLPHGKSTILGGAIRDVDPVLDRFTLKIVGEKPLKILFDERTQVFVDGKKIPLLDLRASDHASVQTTLDGTTVFAISVHILSQAQQGEFRGEVLSYDPSTGDLELVGGHGGDPIRVTVSSNTSSRARGREVSHLRSRGPSDLQSGSLVSTSIRTRWKRPRIGNQRYSSGHSGIAIRIQRESDRARYAGRTMVVLDPKDNQTYQIEFNSGTMATFPNVHPGQRVRVVTEYDGTRYLAHEVSAY